MSNTIAATIIQQLGGNKFRMMTGAKNFINHGHGVTMRIGRNSSNANHFRVDLNNHDLYDLTFSKVSRLGEQRSVREYENVHVEDLVDIFESHTGMYTKLF